MQDWQLLQEFVKHDSQAAFGQLVERHLNFVYSTCLRELQDSGLAEDATQVVFMLLSQKARTFRAGTVLTGWLFQTARFVAKNARKQDIRWRNRSQKGAEEMMHEANRRPSAEAEVWTQIQPMLHDALGHLNAADRDAVLLRCFEGRSLKETGEALNISEEAARKRVTRALDKLRRYFARHGVTLSILTLAALLGSEAVQAAPLAAAGVTSAIFAANTGAVVGTVALSAQSLNLAENVRRAWLLLKIKTAATAVCGVAVVAVGAQHFARPRTPVASTEKPAPTKTVRIAKALAPAPRKALVTSLLTTKATVTTPTPVPRAPVVALLPTPKPKPVTAPKKPHRATPPKPTPKVVIEPNPIPSMVDLPPLKHSKKPASGSEPPPAGEPGKTGDEVPEKVLTREPLPPRENEKDEDMQLKKTMGTALAGATLLANTLAPQAKAADGDKGTLSGLLTAKGDNWIEVRADDAKESKRFSPRWIGGLPKDGGGFDKPVLESFKTLPIPNRVKLDWVIEEGTRVTKVELLTPKDKTGVIEGEVTAKGERWIEVKAGDAPAERYSPRWTEGGPDKDTLHTIGELKVGDKVRLEWAYNERLRIVSLKKIE